MPVTHARQEMDGGDSHKRAALLVTTGAQPGDIVRYAWSN
eukprot:SAG22_NODE_8765_length_631_cov_1.251880_2_plen_39_part_01